MDSTKLLLEVIDKRIDAYIKNSNLVTRNIGKIVSVSGNKAQVTLLGYDSIFTFPYRPYLTDLKEGDNVFIESKIGNLSTGIITDKLYGGE